jgi:hypothetical protein
MEVEENGWWQEGCLPHLLGDRALVRADTAFSTKPSVATQYVGVFSHLATHQNRAATQATLKILTLGPGWVLGFSGKKIYR